MATGYKNDIGPLFRPQDVGCMQRAGVLLDHADWMLDPAGDDQFADHAHARLVGARIAAKTMPPDHPWSDARIALYQAWIAGGFQP
jgi:hypothetical protein